MPQPVTHYDFLGLNSIARVTLKLRYFPSQWVKHVSMENRKAEGDMRDVSIPAMQQSFFPGSKSGAYY